MKLFNFHILKQKTLDERLTDARRDALVIPNKMISRLLWQIHGKKRDSLIQAYRFSQMGFRERVRNA